MTKSPCDCIDTTDELLAEHNTMLVTNLFGPRRALVETIKRESSKRGRPVKVFATYCPFCGVAYPKDAA